MKSFRLACDEIQLSIAFPEALVLDTERPEEDWWASYSSTINKFWIHRKNLPLPPPVAAIFETMDDILVQGVFGGTDRESALKAYRRASPAPPCVRRGALQSAEPS
jgi:hypothetical protein